MAQARLDNGGDGWANQHRSKVVNGWLPEFAYMCDVDGLVSDSGGTQWIRNHENHTFIEWLKFSPMEATMVKFASYALYDRKRTGAMLTANPGLIALCRQAGMRYFIVVGSNNPPWTYYEVLNEEGDLSQASLIDSEEKMFEFWVSVRNEFLKSPAIIAMQKERWSRWEKRKAADD